MCGMGLVPWLMEKKNPEIDLQVYCETIFDKYGQLIFDPGAKVIQ